MFVTTLKWYCDISIDLGEVDSSTNLFIRIAWNTVFIGQVIFINRHSDTGVFLIKSAEIIICIIQKGSDSHKLSLSFC